MGKFKYGPEKAYNIGPWLSSLRFSKFGKVDRFLSMPTMLSRRGSVVRTPILASSCGQAQNNNIK